MADEPDVLTARLNRGIEDPVIPHHYVNGFATSLGSGDIVIVIEKNAKPVATINMSFTVAKTLANSINQAIATLESATGRTMLTTHELDVAMEKLARQVKKQ